MKLLSFLLSRAVIFMSILRILLTCNKIMTWGTLADFEVESLRSVLVCSRIVFLSLTIGC